MEDPKVRHAQDEVARAQAKVNVLENAAASAARVHREKAHELAQAQVELDAARVTLSKARAARAA